MSEPSEAAKAKARELCVFHRGDAENNVARFIQQVSDAAGDGMAFVEGVLGNSVLPDALARLAEQCETKLAPFILPEPVDPLLDEAERLAADLNWAPHELPPTLAGAKNGLLAALKRGIEIGKSDA